MSQAVLRLEVKLGNSDIRDLERLIERLRKKGINAASNDYKKIQEIKNGFRTVVTFQPYENGISVREDSVCTTLLDELGIFSYHESVLSYTLRRNDETVGCCVKIV